MDCNRTLEGTANSLIERERGLLGQLRSSELHTYSMGAPDRASPSLEINALAKELHRVWIDTAAAPMRTGRTVNHP